MYSETKSHYITDSRNLTHVYGSSLLIAFLMTVASVLGLFNPDAVYPSEDLRQSFFANDVVNLVIGLPTLLGAVWLAWRGRLTGLLFWPGALMFVLYNYFAYALSVPVSWIYLLYLTLVVLSLYTMIALMMRIDVDAVEQRLAGAVPVKLSAAVLIILGTFNFLRVFIVVANSLTNPGSVLATDLVVLPSDFFVSPAWILGGVLLWRRTALGYASGLGLLFQGSMLFIGLIAFLLLQPLMTDAAFEIFDVIVVAIMGLICFIPFGLFLKGTLQGAK
jgi:hypothetical protein